MRSALSMRNDAAIDFHVAGNDECYGSMVIGDAPSMQGEN